MKITEIITIINEMIVEISENVVKVLHPPTVANRSNNATLLVIVKRLDVIIRPRSIFPLSAIISSPASTGKKIVTRIPKIHVKNRMSPINESCPLFIPLYNSG